MEYSLRPRGSPRFVRAALSTTKHNDGSVFKNLEAERSCSSFFPLLLCYLIVTPRKIRQSLDSGFSFFL